MYTLVNQLLQQSIVSMSIAHCRKPIAVTYIFNQLRTIFTIFALSLFFIQTGSAQMTVAFDPHLPPVAFAVSRLEEALQVSGSSVRKIDLSRQTTKADIIIAVVKETDASAIHKEGFQISRTEDQPLRITATDATGAMYGVLDMAEQLSMGKSLKSIATKTVNPLLAVRAIKFNLPWSSYRYGPAMEQHMEICRDLQFWQKFLDQMAENRFNMLSLWNVHPFSFMVKPKNFPLANNFSVQEMQEWQHFWKSLFRMAKDRGIETFIVNWNIAVSPEFAKAYNVHERNDTSAFVKRYTREVVTQVINEYEDLSGIGITLADWMSNFKQAGTDSWLPDMTPKDREVWIEETVIAGIKAAKRPVKLLHRSVLSAEPQEMRRVITEANLPDTTLVEIKFNWSHGHSTPYFALTHDSHSGKRDDGYWNPLPTDYRIQWMIRNEDFFILRWGQADFIRKHISQNTEPYVNGYFVGSEGYIPAKDYSHLPGVHRTWNYAFEKQWLFYQLWGRLLYNPATPDAVFAASFNKRYGNKTGETLLTAYASASEMPLRLASFFAGTWDYTLYSEGFLAPFAAKGLHDQVSSFISVDELIDHQVLDTSYLSIKDYTQHTLKNRHLTAGKISPLSLADQLESGSIQTMQNVARLRPKASGAMACELDDLETWAYLSKYFADKLRAGVSLQLYRLTKEKAHQQQAIAYLEKCLTHWKKVSEITSKHYQEVPYIEGQELGGNQAYKDAWRFSWKKFLPQVARDIQIAKEARPAVE